MRALCHRSICQEFNDAEFGDFVCFRLDDVEMPSESLVRYQGMKRLPPLVQRGKCKACHLPAVEYLKFPLFPSLVMVPSVNVQDKSILIEPAGHFFYETRVRDHPDQLPKFEGYWQSQLGFTKHLMGLIFR